MIKHLFILAKASTSDIEIPKLSFDTSRFGRVSGKAAGTFCRGISKPSSILNPKFPSEHSPLIQEHSLLSN